MDLVLPGKMLAQIVSFLSKKDCNSLIRTSKTAYNKLNSHRNLLPKAKVDVAISLQDENVSCKMRINSVERWIVDIPTQPPNQLVADDAEVYSKLLTYYKEMTVWSNEHFCLSYIDGMSFHMQFLFDHFLVGRLRLLDLSEESCEEITRFIKENRRNVPDLWIKTEHLPQCTLELIAACMPDTLEIEGYELPDGFFEAPGIKNVENLSTRKTINNMSDQHLLSLTGVSLSFLRASDITIQGILSFLTAWVEAKREVRTFQLAVRWILSVNEWKAMFAELDPDLVDVDIFHDTGDIFSAKMQRRSDGVVIIFGTTQHIITMYNELVDYNHMDTV